MKMIAVAVVCAVAALAAAGFAWQRNQALEAARHELASVSPQLQKAKADIQSMTAEVDALRKESAEQKMATDQLRSDLNTAKAFLEAEKATALRLREELASAKALLASASRSRGGQPSPAPASVQPMAIPSQPTAIRAAPRGTAAGAGALAR